MKINLASVRALQHVQTTRTGDVLLRRNGLRTGLDGRKTWFNPSVGTQ